MLAFGVTGYIFTKLGYPLPPLVLAIVLGDKAEDSFRQAMLVSQGDIARGVDVLQKAVSAAPGNLSARYHLAYGWFKVGDTARARNELKTLLSTEMSFPERGDAASLVMQLR